MPRVYFRCSVCGEGTYPADDMLGIDGYLSIQARRLVCLAGACESFAKAERLLHELAGWDLSDEAIRQVAVG